MATPEHITDRRRQRVYHDASNAAVLAARAVGALQLAIKGMAEICADSEPGPQMIEALEWLGDFANDAAEASMALSNDVPARWSVFYDQAGALKGLAGIPDVKAA